MTRFKLHNATGLQRYTPDRFGKNNYLVNVYRCDRFRHLHRIGILRGNADDTSVCRIGDARLSRELCC